ncbi:Xanthine phosphoribosyltransferase 1 [Termitomyces sp. T112]|nr:Xanthine phosphoribosyltransferase 1 [Termitomyces sp. T112]
MAEGQVKHWRVTYNDIHNLIRGVTPKLAQDFNPDLMVAIGGGGFFPARVMRTFLREITENKALQIQAIGLSLYEPLPGTSQQQIGKEVVRTQWMWVFDFFLQDSSFEVNRSPNPGKLLLGKRVLIVDEVDDTRKTLGYALTELRKDVEEELTNHPESERETLRAATKFAIFVVHNKAKPKLAELPEGISYYAGEEVDDVWLDYPWEAMDITEHDRLAAEDRKSVA